MVERFSKKIRLRLAKWLAPEYHAQVIALEKRVNGVEEILNQRIAKVLLELDPMEMVMRKYHGIFSEQFERPEERLNEAGRLGMMMMGYQLKNDIYFKHLIDFILDTQGNNTVRRAKTEHEWFFGRACLITVEVFMKEINRLANLYDEKLNKDKLDFDPDVVIE